MMRMIFLALSVVSVSVIATAMVADFPSKLTFNASRSAPIGLYWINPASGLKRGDYVVVPTPPTFKEMADRRGYLPSETPLIKRVFALENDRICRFGVNILVNGKHVVTALLDDSQGRKLPKWEGCFTLGPQQFFALMNAQDSFDSRYFGPLNRMAIIGIAKPIWVRQTPETKSKN